MGNVIFDIGKWQGALIYAPARFQDLGTYLRNEPLIETHVSSTFELFQIDDHGNETRSPISPNVIKDFKDSFSQSHEHYANMMIVTAGTYLENIIFDFFKNYFSHKPNALHEYVSSGESRGYIKVTEAVSHNSMDELINTLASRAAKNAGGGPPTEIFNRIKKLTKHSVTDELRERIEELVRTRNSIAHEIRSFAIEKLDVEGTYESLSDLLEELGNITKSLKLPFYDPGHLLDL